MTVMLLLLIVAVVSLALIVMHHNAGERWPEVDRYDRVNRALGRIHHRITGR